MNNLDSKKLKIGYFADGPWSHRALDLLASDSRLSVSFICARYPNSDQYLNARAVELGIEFYVVENVNSDLFISAIDVHKCDLFVSMSFDQILRKNFHSHPPLGTINCHAGRLPFYRGRNILNWALINDENDFGITVHYVDDGVDTGDIILQRLYPICDEDDYASLLATAYKECPAVLYEAIKLISSGSAKRIPQESIHPCGSTYSQRKPGDEKIDWHQSSREIFNFIRALTRPGPLACTQLDGNMVQIVKAEMIVDAPDYKCIPGAILSKDSKGFLVKTGDTFIRITEWISEAKLAAGRRFS
jgi:methionyl-tRNA formyltransferase